MMREVGQLIVGWINANICEVNAAEVFSRFGWILLTSIDSTVDLFANNLGQRIVSFNSRCSFLGQGVIVPGELVVKVAAAFDLFNGFDEIWCFQQFPKIPKPNDLWIVSPFNIETDPLPPSLASWMAQTDCKLGLGDGIGLNFVTPEKEIASIMQSLTE